MYGLVINITTTYQRLI